MSSVNHLHRCDSSSIARQREKNGLHPFRSPKPLPGQLLAVRWRYFGYHTVKVCFTDPACKCWFAMPCCCSQRKFPSARKFTVTLVLPKFATPNHATQISRRAAATLTGRVGSGGGGHARKLLYLPLMIPHFSKAAVGFYRQMYESPENRRLWIFYEFPPPSRANSAGTEVATTVSVA